MQWGMYWRDTSFMKYDIIFGKINQSELIVSIFRENSFLIQIIKFIRFIKSITRKIEFFAFKFHFNTQTRNRMERVVEIKFASKNVVRMTHFNFSILEEIL